MLQDLRIENDLNFSLQQSLARAQERPLFQVSHVYVLNKPRWVRKVLMEVFKSTGSKNSGQKENLTSQKNVKIS